MALFGRRQVDATVTALAWRREVTMEVLQWVARRSDWPPGDDARNVQKHTQTVLQPPGGGLPGPGGQPGSGGFPGSEGFPGGGGFPGTGGPAAPLQPAFLVHYTYEVAEWRRGRSLTASGTSTAGVDWPDDTPGPGERVGSRRESYTVTLDARGKRYETSLPEPQWRALEQGAACTLTLGPLGGVREVTRVGA